MRKVASASRNHNICLAEQHGYGQCPVCKLSLTVTWVKVWSVYELQESVKIKVGERGQPICRGCNVPMRVF